MKTEIIIAARCEKPECLERTVKEAAKVADVTVVLDGNEPNNNVQPGLPCRVLRPWDAPRGCGQCRHYGITQSEADLIVLCDGHMDFPAGWMKAIQKAHRKPKRLTCCQMSALDLHWQRVDDLLVSGAKLRVKILEALDDRSAIGMKAILDSGTSGEVPCIFGACYAFRREWYDSLAQPLRILENWGQDEEILSCATWIAGGTVLVLPVVVGHVMSLYHPCYDRHNTADHDVALRSNRFATVHALPMSDKLHRELRTWLHKRRPIYARDDPEKYIADERFAAIWEVRERLRSAGRSLDWMMEQGLAGYPTPEEAEEYMRPGRKKATATEARPVTTSSRPPPAPVNDVAQVVVRKREVCKMCGAVDSFIMLGGARTFDAFSQAYGRCKFCGHKAHIQIH